jgi:hypothetical protein
MILAQQGSRIVEASKLCGTKRSVTRMQESMQ